MSTKIFPDSILSQSADQIFNEKNRLSGVLYLTTLIVICLALIAINYITVDISVQAAGTIKPEVDRTVVLATSNGYVQLYSILQNASINKGDTLLVIQSELITAKLPMLQKRKEELDALIHDLTLLTTHSPYSVKLTSPMYRQDVLYYISQWNEADTKRKQAKTAFERSKKLFEANVIPLSEFEPVELEYNQAENAIQTLTKHQKRQWQSDLIGYKNELNDIEAQISQIDVQHTETVICSPVTGTVQYIQTIFDGSYVTSGQQLLEISPDGNLIAECYVTPKDIGYLSIGMQGKVQISSFNYTEWGMLNAKISQIFDDVTISSDGQQSFYKVYCALDRNYLTLKNGYKGFIKKGMVVNTNFTVTSRTVFQLLYDKIDNWLNPYINKDNEKRN